ncbi:MAG: hypothetical protein AAGJ35_09525 [Myxococcota bacterium]
MLHWDNRVCCDEEGNPDYEYGWETHLTWQNEKGGWEKSWLEVQVDTEDEHSSIDVSFTPDGEILLERPVGSFRKDPRLLRLLGAHPREAWLNRDAQKERQNF